MAEAATDQPEKKVVLQPANDDREIASTLGFGIMGRLTFGLGVIAFLVLGCGGWAMTAEISGAVIAPGSVVVERHVKKIQHRDGGIVSAIKVRNGDTVEAGDVLVTLDDTQLNASLSMVRAQLIELTGRSARLVAERDGFDEIKFPDDFLAMGPEAAQVEAGEKRLFIVNEQSRSGQVEQLKLRIEQLNSEISGLKAQFDAKSTEHEFIEKELKSVRSLHKRQLTPITRVYAMEREATRLKGEKGRLTSQIARAEGQISEIRVQILAIEQSVRSDAQKQLRDIQARMTELRERRIAAQDQLNRVELRAPLAGVVHELAVHTVGGVITPAEPVMLIVPKGDKLTVQARIAPSDIDQLRPGQQARLRFSAFNQQSTPEIDGRVTKVSADVTQDPANGQRYYTTQISIDDNLTEKLGDLEILPGMPVEVFVTTQQRTALSFLTKPFVDQLSRSFREE